MSEEQKVEAPCEPAPEAPKKPNLGDILLASKAVEDEERKEKGVADNDMQWISTRRREGLGDFAGLTDKVILKILEDTTDLRTLLSMALVSKAFHLLANSEELWRKVCLERWNGDFIWKHSWKSTTLFPNKGKKKYHITQEYIDYKDAQPIHARRYSTTWTYTDE